MHLDCHTYCVINGRMRLGEKECDLMSLYRIISYIWKLKSNLEVLADHREVIPLCVCFMNNVIQDAWSTCLCKNNLCVFLLFDWLSMNNYYCDVLSRIHCLSLETTVFRRTDWDKQRVWKTMPSDAEVLVGGDFIHEAIKSDEWPIDSFIKLIFATSRGTLCVQKHT